MADARGGAEDSRLSQLEAPDAELEFWGITSPGYLQSAMSWRQVAYCAERKLIPPAFNWQVYFGHPVSNVGLYGTKAWEMKNRPICETAMRIIEVSSIASCIKISEGHGIVMSPK